MIGITVKTRLREDKMLKGHVAGMTVGFLLSGAACTPTAWEKPGATQAGFDQDRMLCQTRAGGDARSFEFAGGAALGNAVSTGAEASGTATYRDCMGEMGYTIANGQMAANIAKIRPVFSREKTCLSALYTSPDTEALRAHLLVRLTPDQLANRSLATDQEIAALNAVQPRLHQCEQSALDQLANVMPSLVPIVSASYSKGAEQTALLNERKITWGEYNTARRARATQMQSQITAELHQSN
jgi:hypothetical protein